MNNNYNTADLTNALAEAARAFLRALDEKTETAPRLHAVGPLNYDPLVEAPPLPFGPHGNEREEKMTSLVYLTSLARINAEKHRGASSAEVARFAKAAGYPDGRAVNGWNSRPGSPRVIENIDGLRYLNERGHAYIRELADELGLRLTGDITPLPIPGEEE